MAVGNSDHLTLLAAYKVFIRKEKRQMYTKKKNSEFWFANGNHGNYLTIKIVIPEFPPPATK